MKYLLPLLLVFCTPALAARVDTILVHSTVMNKDIKCVVIQPSQPATIRTAANAAGTSRLPVIYLLHGYSGNYAQWPATAPQLSKEADDLGILFVSPDGGYDSWYFDSPVDSSVRYETFMTKELIPYIDAHYPTVANRDTSRHHRPQHGRTRRSLSRYPA